jgi:CheY-like chemotaxis protein
MIKPLALVFYENLLPGTQVVNRLQDLSYRVQAVADAAKLVESAEQTKPMLVLADLNCARTDICAALARLRQNPSTRHLPVIGFGGDPKTDLHAAALAAGVTLVVSEAAILHHLPECLDQALQVE